MDTEKLTTMSRDAVSAAVRNALAIVGLGLIITSGWWIAGVQEYPAALALVPVGATLLIIWTGSAATRDPRGPPIVRRCPTAACRAQSEAGPAACSAKSISSRPVAAS